MIKKREICCIVFILLGTVLLAFSSRISEVLSYSSGEEKGENEKTVNRYVSVRFSGELNVEEIVFTVPYGSSFGGIVHKLSKYTNEYSVLPLDGTERFFEDKDIVILTSDLKNIEDADLSGDKISIHTASKDELTTLYGIGEKRAEKIMEYRKTKRIESFEELKAVIGVSDEIIGKIKDKAVL